MAKNCHNRFIFEQLEPRVLLSADVLPNPLDVGLPDEYALDVPSVVETALEQDSGVPQHTTGAEYQRLEVIFIDAGVPDSQKLVDDLLRKLNNNSQIDVVVLESIRGGIEQISETLAQSPDLDGVHIISHGTDGSVQLGNTWLNRNNIAAFADAIQGWQDSFAAGADLLFYGCNLAAGDDGRALIDTLGSLTGADVAASDDITGNTGLGGDWVLEYTQGTVESKIIASLETEADWLFVLPTTTINDGAAPSNRNVWGGGYRFTASTFTLVTDDLGGDILTDLDVTFSGTDISDVANNEVQIWRDDGSTSNTWDESDLLLGTTSFVGNTASFGGLGEGIDTTETQYLITYNIDSAATATNVLQAEVTAATVTTNPLLNNDDPDATLTVEADQVHETSIYKFVYNPGIGEELYLKNTDSPTTNILQGMSLGSVYLPGPPSNPSAFSLLTTWDPDATVTTVVDNAAVKQVQMSGRLMNKSGVAYGDGITNITFYEDRFVFDLSITMDNPNPLVNEWMFMTYGTWDKGPLDPTFLWSHSNNAFNSVTVPPNFNSLNRPTLISYQTRFELGLSATGDGLVNSSMQDISNYFNTQLKNTDGGTSSDIAFQKQNPAPGTTYQAAVQYSFDTTDDILNSTIANERQDDFASPATLNFGIAGGDGTDLGYVKTRGAYTLDDNDADDHVRFEFQTSTTAHHAPAFEITNWDGTAPVVITVDSEVKDIGVDYNAAVDGTTLYLQYLGDINADTICEIGDDSISGTVFSDEGTTPLVGTSVHMLVNGVDAGTTISDTNGRYAFYQTLAASDTILVYLDDNVIGTNDGTSVTVIDGDALTGLDIYVDHLITRHDESGVMTNILMDAADGAGGDAEILYGVNIGNNLTVSGANTELFIPTTYSFTPGGHVTTEDLKISGTLTAGTYDITVTGDWDSFGGLFEEETSTVILGTSGQSHTLSINHNEDFNNFTIVDSATITVAPQAGVTRLMTWGEIDLSGTLSIPAGFNFLARQMGPANPTVTINANGEIAGAGKFTRLVDDNTEHLVNNGTISIATFEYDIRTWSVSMPVTATTYGGDVVIKNWGSLDWASYLGRAPGDFTSNFVIGGDLTLWHDRLNKTLSFDNSVENIDISIGGDLIVGNLADNTRYASFNAGSATVNVGGNVIIADSDVPGSTFINAGSSTWNISGDMDIRGTLTGGTSTFNIGGNWDHSTGIFSYDTSTVVMSGAGNNTITTPEGGLQFYTMTIDPGADITATTSYYYAIGGDLTISGTMNVAATKTVGYQNVLTMTDNAILSGPGTFRQAIRDIYNGNTFGVNTTISVGTYHFYLQATTYPGFGRPIQGRVYDGNLLINSSGMTTDSFVYLTGGDLTVNGDLTIEGRNTALRTVFNNSVENHNITTNNLIIGENGSPDNYAELMAGSGNIDINGDVTIYASDGSGTNLIDAGSSTWNVSGNMDIRDTLTGGTSTFTVAGDWDSSNGTWWPQTSNVILTGTGTLAQYTAATPWNYGFYNLTLAAAGQTTTLTSSNLWVRYLTTGSGTFTDAANNYTVVLQGTGNVFTDGGGPLTLNSLMYRVNNSTQNVVGRDYSGINQLRFNTVGGAGGTGIYEMQGNIIANDISFTVNNQAAPGYDRNTILNTNDFSIIADTLYIGTNGQPVDYAVLNAGASTIDINDDVVIYATDANGTSGINAGSSTWNVSGNWNNYDIFTAGTSTVNLSGGDQAINGSTEFYNLSKVEASNDGIDVTLTFDNTATQTVNGNFILDGLDNNDRIKLVSDSPANQWSINLTASAIKGTMDYLVVADSDASGSVAAHKPLNPANSANGGNNIDWFDTTAPTVTVNLLTTNDTTPKLTGTVNDPAAAIQVTLNGNIYAAANNGNGTWALADNTIVTALADGIYEVVVTATDANSNVGSDASANELTVDSTAPVVTVNLLSTSDTTPALTGTVDDTAATILVTLNGNTYAASNNGDGTWILADNTIAPALAEGIYEIAVIATDDTANAGADSTANELSVDTTAQIITVNLLSTSDTTPALTGTVDDTAATILVTLNGNTYAASNNGDGTWTLADNTITPALAEGIYEIAVIATDAAANVGADATTNELTVDITAPLLTVNLLATSDTNPELTGTVDDTAATILVTLNGNTYAASNNGDGTWTLADNTIAPELAEGIYEIAIIATDAAANVGADATTNELTVDITAPLLTVNLLATSDTNPELTGTVDDTAATIQVTVNGNSYAAANNGDGTWTLADNTITPELVEGIYEIAVIATDTAANAGADATTNELTLDTTAPVVTVKLLTTTDTTPALAGTVDDTEATIQVTVNGNNHAATNNGDGTWNLADNTIAPELAEGIYEIAVIATDSVANVGVDPTANELTVFTFVPIEPGDKNEPPDIKDPKEPTEKLTGPEPKNGQKEPGPGNRSIEPESGNGSIEKTGGNSNVNDSPQPENAGEPPQPEMRDVNITLFQQTEIDHVQDLKMVSLTLDDGDKPTINGDPQSWTSDSSVNYGVDDDSYINNLPSDNRSIDPGPRASIELIRASIDAIEQREIIFTTTLKGATITLSTGLAIWVLRAGSLVASTISSMPIWKGFDLLPVLSLSNKKRREKIKEIQSIERDEKKEYKKVADLLDKDEISEYKNTID